MSKQLIHTPSAPAPVGAYSQAIKHDRTIYISGQIPLNPETGRLENNTFEDQVLQVLRNVNAVITEAGGSMNSIVKATIFITQMDNFSIVNSVYTSFFQAPFPARAVVEVSALPMGVDVEMDAIAIL